MFLLYVLPIHFISWQLILGKWHSDRNEPFCHNFSVFISSFFIDITLYIFALVTKDCCKLKSYGRVYMLSRKMRYWGWPSLVH